MVLILREFMRSRLLLPVQVQVLNRTRLFIITQARDDLVYHTTSTLVRLVCGVVICMFRSAMHLTRAT